MSGMNLVLPIGQRVSLPGHFDVPVVLEDARPLGNDGAGGYECRVRLPDGSLDEAIISVAEAQALVAASATPQTATQPVDVERLRLLIESARLRLAYAYDRQFAVSLSGIRTLPHQIEAVYQRMLPQPRLRFLLADDPGAGKTIMAGLLVKELKLREAIERVLILCPAPLTIQWQDEMLRWFGEPFDIIFAAVDQQQLVNPWQRASQVIASLDYAKQDDVRERVWQQRWDLVIIDEAHKCSAYTRSQTGRSDEAVETKRYQLAKRLTADADHVLLLTATPHHGDEDRFAHFLRILDPDLFPEPHRVGVQAATIRKNVFRLGDDCPWALRRLKEDLKDLNGHRLFPDRHAHTVSFRLNGEEYTLYKAVTAYINEFLPQPVAQASLPGGQRRSSAALARTVLQRRLASSTHAIHESLKRRLQKQQELLEKLEQMTPAQRARWLASLQGRLTDTEQEEDDLDEAARDQLTDEYTAALELEQLRAEIVALKDLVEQARRVREQANDSEEGEPIIEGRILHRLLEKLDQMRDALAGRVFDVIGEVLSLNDVNLPEMLRDAAYDPRRLDDYIDQIDRIDPERLKQYEEATGIALARANVDFTGFQARNLEVEERRLMPRYVESQFVAAAREVGLRMEARADGLWRVEHVLADLRSERLQAVQQLGKPETTYRKITFHKHHLEQDAHLDAVLLGPGHPLYAAVDERLNEKLSPLIGQAAFCFDPLATAPYRLHFFEIAIRGKNTKGKDVPLYGELVAVREEGRTGILPVGVSPVFEIVPSDVLLDLPPYPTPPASIEMVNPQPAADFLKGTYQLECRSRCQHEREHFAKVCRDYLVESFKARIYRAQDRVMILRGREREAPEIALARQRAEQDLADLERTRKERFAGLDRLSVARTGPVRHLATAVVLTPDRAIEVQLGVLARETDADLRRRKEIRAEDLTIESLVAEGFSSTSIERVGSQKIGFDIRAHRVIDEHTGQIEVRRIEVKGYTKGTPIQLTVNEWYKAQQLTETYWLYVVWDPLGVPELVRIQNPAVKLDHAKREVIASRFFEIAAEAINQHVDR